MHCAPLQTLGFTSAFNVTPEQSHTRYYYGGAFDANGEQGSDYTEQFSNDQSYNLTETMKNRADTAGLFCSVGVLLVLLI